MPLAVDGHKWGFDKHELLNAFAEFYLMAVETGRHYFPHCSKVVDKFLDDDMPDALFLDKGTPEEQKTKKMRFTELKDDVQKAFYKDMENNNRSARSSSSSSSSSPKSGVTYKARRKF